MGKTHRKNRNDWDDEWDCDFHEDAIEDRKRYNKTHKQIRENRKAKYQLQDHFLEADDD